MLRLMHDTVRGVVNSNTCGEDTWYLEAADTLSDGWRWGDGVLQSANNNGYDYDANGYDKISDETPASGKCLRLKGNKQKWEDKDCTDQNQVACMVSLSPSAWLEPTNTTTFPFSLLSSSPSSFSLFLATSSVRPSVPPFLPYLDRHPET